MCISTSVERLVSEMIEINMYMKYIEINGSPM